VAAYRSETARGKVVEHPALVLENACVVVERTAIWCQPSRLTKHSIRQEYVKVLARLPCCRSVCPDFVNPPSLVKPRARQAEITMVKALQNVVIFDGCGSKSVGMIHVFRLAVIEDSVGGLRS
jgi:hypothetical protein